MHHASPTPRTRGVLTLPPVGVGQVRELMNWTYFTHFWRVRPGSAEAHDVLSDARALLDELQAEGLTLRAQVAFWPAWGGGDTIHIEGPTHRPVDTGRAPGTPRRGGHPVVELPTPRSAGGEALADFVAPKGQGDHIGLFAVTLGPELLRRVEQAKAGSDDYAALLLQSVCDRLAEATSEWLHREVRTRLWGYAPAESLTPDELRRGHYQGIRPAVGYPCLPDQRAIFTLAPLLRLDELGLRLTENGAMYPQSSVLGLYLASPESHYWG